MAAKSIILTTAEVQALQAGELRELRREVKDCYPMSLRWKEVPCERCKGTGVIYLHADPDYCGQCDGNRYVFVPDESKRPLQPGDVASVREKWQDYCPLWFGVWCGHGTQEGIVRDHKPVYFADPSESQLRPSDKDGSTMAPAKWRSPATMPAWASRYRIRITSVRAERGEAWQWVYGVEVAQ